MARRVVITGLGVVSGLGVGSESLWAGLVEGRSALKRITRLDPSGFACRLGAEVPGFTARDHVPKAYRKAVKVMSRDAELAIGAARLAVLDASLITRSQLAEDATEGTTYPPARMGCQIGAGVIPAETQELTAALSTARDANGVFDLGAWGTEADASGESGRGGMNNLPPLWMLKYLPNMLACHVTIIHGAEGPSNTITCGEASGLLSLGESSRVIERGDADLCFSGGAESKLNHLGLVRMSRAGRLAATGDVADGTGVVMPFDPASGGLPGEAGAILALEERGSALRRGARAYAEVAGFGAAQSAPVTWPMDAVAAGGVEDGLGLAIERALNDAGVPAVDVDAIVPQGAGVPALDAREARALRGVFGARLGEIPIVTTTPNVGQCMAGHGGVLASVGAKALMEQRLPARIHKGRESGGLRAAAAHSMGARLRHVVVCSSSLGGQNAALVLSAIVGA